VGKTTNLKGTGNLNPNSPTGGSIVVADVTGGSTIASSTATTGGRSTATTTPSPQRGEGGGEGKTAGSFPGQGIEHRSDRANEVARNTEKNKHLNGGNPGGEQGAVNSNKGGNGNAAGTSNNPGNTGGTGGNNAGGNGGNNGNGGGNGNGNGNSGNSGGGGAGQGNGREFIYFYHPDHLGSTGYVTDEKALRYEHIAYFPFGETWVQESSATWRVPYQFTSKEMDPETGLYYFGARYYDPRTSVWQSADPILNKYLPKTPTKPEEFMQLQPVTVQHPLACYNLPGTGGVFNPVTLAMYSYAGLNPLKYVDPDGNEITESVKVDPIAGATVNGSSVRVDKLGFSFTYQRTETVSSFGPTNTDPVPTHEPSVPETVATPSVPSKIDVVKAIGKELLNIYDGKTTGSAPVPGQPQTRTVEKSSIKVEGSIQINSTREKNFATGEMSGIVNTGVEAKVNATINF
jgi:RHS repeat-associated protein